MIGVPYAGTYFAKNALCESNQRGIGQLDSSVSTVLPVKCVRTVGSNGVGCLVCHFG